MCVCPIAVSDLTLFFIYTCSYLHPLTRKYTSRHIHHITTHHIYITLQNVSGTDCSLGGFLGFLFSLFSLLLATHRIFHLSFCEVFPLFSAFGFSFCAVCAIFWNMDIGFCILNFNLSFGATFAAFHPQNNKQLWSSWRHCFWHLVSRFARYLRYFGTWTLDFAFWNFNLSFGTTFAACHPKITNNCGLLVVLAILCCCGCSYRACFLRFWLFLLLLLFLLFLLVCGCCCACGSGFGCSCGW